MPVPMPKVLISMMVLSLTGVSDVNKSSDATHTNRKQRWEGDDGQDGSKEEGAKEGDDATVYHTRRRTLVVR